MKRLISVTAFSLTAASLLASPAQRTATRFRRRFPSATSMRPVSNVSEPVDVPGGWHTQPFPSSYLG